MAWVKGFKITGGLLAGQIFSVGGGSLSDTTWTDAPDINANIFDRCYGENEGTFEGVNCLVTLQNIHVNDTVVLWALEIEQDTHYKSELICKMHCINNSGGFEVELYRREWTDMQTYADTLVSNYTLTPQFHWNNPHQETKKLHAVFVQSNYNGYPVYFTGFSCQDYVNYWQEYHYYLDGFAIDMYKLHDVLGGDPDEGEYSPEFGDAADEGGYVGGDQGTHDKSSDHSGIPAKPQYGFSSAGFLNHYIITSAGLEKLGPAIFPEPLGQSSSVEEALDRLAYNNWNSKLLDFLIDCRIIPVRPDAPTTETITAGGKGFQHPVTHQTYEAPFITEDYVDFDCGTLHTDLTEGNFLDFSLARAQLFLPFYGYVEIAPEYWHGADLGVYYRFNMMDGSFMIWVTSKAFKSDMVSTDVIGQYAGNACIHLPINSLSYSNVISGMITTGAAIVGAVASGGIGAGMAAGATKAALTHAEISKANATTGALGSASGAAFSGLGAAQNSRPQLIHNNTYNGSASMMSKRCPYLLIEFPNAQFSTSYTDENGLPLVVEKQLGTLSGMTVCSNAIIDFPCTDQEAQAILGALQEGVIL